MAILIKNGTVVTPSDRRIADVRCRGRGIVEVGPNLPGETGETELDASGQLVFPGGVDPHVHMQLPVAGTVSSDDFESGTAAGLAGGTTTIIDFVHPERGEDYLQALRERKREASAAVADYGLHMGVTWWGDGTAAALARCVREEGLSSFKAYMAYKETVGLDDADLIRVMRTSADLGALLLLHAEHGEMIEDLRDRLAASGRTEPRFHGATLYIVHVTCREALRAIAEARAEGLPVHGETCPHYLLLDDSVYDKPDFEGAAFVCAPPIRPVGHQEALWEALATGDIQAVGTDHCPFNMHQRMAGQEDFRLIPGGTAGIEHRLALLYTHGVAAGRIDLHRFVDLVSTRPAKLFGLYPRKGSLSVGADADIVVWDPEATATLSAESHHHQCDCCIFEGFQVKGMPSTVVSNGKIVYRHGDLRIERGAGRFLRRATSSA